jgi:acyl-CoA thioester hydrolase
VWEKRIEIRWRDVDASRHVNNAVYLTYLEELRTRWIEHALGTLATPYDFVLVRVAIDYRRELTLRDGVVVGRCRLDGLGTSSIRTVEELRTEGGELAAEAQAVTVAWDPDSGRSRPLTELERHALERA